MILLTADEDTLDGLFEIVTQRAPQPLVILIGEGAQPQLLDGSILKPNGDSLLGMLSHPLSKQQLPVYASPAALPHVEQMRLHFELLPVAPAASLDRMSLEIAYGLQLILTRVPLPVDATHQSRV